MVESSLASFREHGFGMWLLLRKPRCEPIGFCGLRCFDEPPEVEILYGLLPALWGTGLATEASREVLRFAFATLGLERVYAGTDPPNAPSLRVFERLGMTFDGRRIVHGLDVVYDSIDRRSFEGGASP